MGPRWWKVVRDAWTERWRLAGMIAAIAASLVAVATVLGAYAVLTREIAGNYLATRPADATIEVGAPVTPDLVARVRASPGVAEVEAGEVMRARFAVGDGWKPLLLFVVDDAAHQRLATPRPAPGDRVGIERTAAQLFGVREGDRIRIRLDDGATGELRVDAIVHDPGLAPAWQERLAYVYVPRPALEAAVGRPVPVHDLRVRFVDRRSTAEVDAGALALAAGLPAHQVRVPPFEMHPHQRQMTTVLTMFLMFSGLSLVLSAILVATSLAALLARQVREIGVLKTLGATRGQLAGMYVGLVGALGLSASALAIPIGWFGATALSRATATLLNIALEDPSPPLWVGGVVAIAGVGVPLLLAAIPIGRAAGISVRQALDQHGVSAVTLRPAFARLPRAVRARIRRPARLALTLGLLGSAGAMLVSAQSVSESWDLSVAKIDAARFDDVEVRFAAPVPVADLARVPGRRVEAWDFAQGVFADERGEIGVSRTWPDRGHGSLAVIGVPLDTELLTLPVTAGRWLDATDVAGAVLNQGAASQRGGVRVGDELRVWVEGERRDVRVVGLVEEIGSPGAVYVPRDPAAPTATMVRVAGAEPRAVEAALDAAPIEGVIPRSELSLAVGGHVAILVQTLTALAVAMAAVGGLGLASTASIDVVERTREIGVLKTLGATPAQIARMLVIESLVTGVASTALAYGGAVPLILGIDGVVGRLGFLAPLPFAFSTEAAAIWFVAVAVLSVIATAGPAGRAGALTVREALAVT